MSYVDKKKSQTVAFLARGCNSKINDKSGRFLNSSEILSMSTSSANFRKILPKVNEGDENIKQMFFFSNQDDSQQSRGRKSSRSSFQTYPSFYLYPS